MKNNTKNKKKRKKKTKTADNTRYKMFKITTWLNTNISNEIISVFQVNTSQIYW